MNNLSWLIYFSDILPNIRDVIQMLSFVALVILLISMFILSVEGIFRECKKAVFTYLAIFSTALILSTLIPSKSTILLIASSEASEVFVESPKGNEIISKVNQILDVQLDNLVNEGAE